MPEHLNATLASTPWPSLPIVSHAVFYASAPSDGRALLLGASDIALDIPDVRQYPASASFRVHRMSTVVMF